MFSCHAEIRAAVDAPVDRVFAYVDDHARLSAHMTKSSWMMGGGRMDVQTDDGFGQRVGSHIRLAGRAFGLQLGLDEVVVERTPPFRKVWQTIGEPNILIIGRYCMGFELSPRPKGSALRVFIDYDLPGGFLTRWFGRLFADLYARWCTRRMARDAAAHFAAARSDIPASNLEGAR